MTTSSRGNPPAEISDPRVYFAAERTLLAWLRTGIAVIGLGFVVARFGLFLKMIHHGPEASSNISSTIIGVGLILLGAVASGVATWQHMRFFQGLTPPERPRRYWMSLSMIFGFALTAISFALAAHLVVRSTGQWLE
jgi:putative membrane protein